MLCPVCKTEMLLCRRERDADGGETVSYRCRSGHCDRGKGGAVIEVRRERPLEHEDEK